MLLSFCENSQYLKVDNLQWVTVNFVTSIAQAVRLFRVPWTASRFNQSILKEISPECSLEGLMLKLKLKLQYFDHLTRRACSLEKTLMLERLMAGGKRGNWG